jgi:hypothetical protein
MTRSSKVVAARLLLILTLFASLGCEDSGSSTEAASTIDQVPLPSCTNPVGLPGAFLDGMPDSGLDFIHSSGDLLDEHSRIAAHAGELSAGVVAADLDADGFVDLFLPQLSGANGLYWGHGDGSYSAAPPGHGAELIDAACQGASIADYDGDGLPDLLVLGREVLTLLHNNGDRSFLDVSSAAGLTPAEGTSATSAWADFDDDGDLDLAVGNYGGEPTSSGGNPTSNALWRNDQGHFTEFGQSLREAVEGPGATLHMLWRDFDDDGDPDLLILNDRGAVMPPSVLLENLGEDGGQWSFQDRLLASGTGRLEQPMGASIVDLDRDGQRDLWFSNIGRTQAFSGNGTWQWIERSASWASNLSTFEDAVSWAVVDLDLAGTGDPSILITYGPLLGEYEPLDEQEWLHQPDRFLSPEWDLSGTLRFVAADEVFPVEMTGNSRGVARADLNDDGVPDLLIGRIDGTPQLLLGRCTESQRLAVKLHAPGTSNPFAIGARVTVSAGDRSQTREVSADGPGPFSASDPQLLFGLGSATQLDTLEIRWPGGRTEKFEDLCSHCTIRIEAPTP